MQRAVAGVRLDEQVPARPATRKLRMNGPGGGPRVTQLRECPAEPSLRRQAWLIAISPGAAGQWFSAASLPVPPARHGDRCWLTPDERRVLRAGDPRGA